jgi:hypothetical protein
MVRGVSEMVGLYGWRMEKDSYETYCEVPPYIERRTPVAFEPEKRPR